MGEDTSEDTSEWCNTVRDYKSDFLSVLMITTIRTGEQNTRMIRI